MTTIETVSARPATTGYQVHTVDDIAEVDPREWDAILDPDDLQATHRFVSICQRSGVEEARYRHVVVRSAGRPAAVASLSRIDVKLELLADTRIRTIVQRIRRARPRTLVVPVAFCGLPVSFGQSCLRIAPGTDLPALMRVIGRELERFGAETGASICCFKEHGPTERAIAAPLRAMGYFHAASLPSCRLDIGWRSFDEYLDALRAGYRRQVRATLRAREVHGLRFRTVQDFGPDCPRLFALYEQVMARAPVQLERLNLRFFAELNRVLGPESGAIVVEREGETVAAAILLYGPRLTTFLLAGIDYEVNRSCHAYPNLVTEVVANAIRRGASALEMGQTSYVLKRRFGASTTERAIYLKCRARLMHTLLEAARPVLFPELDLPALRVFRGP